MAKRRFIGRTRRQKSAAARPARADPAQKVCWSTALAALLTLVGFFVWRGAFDAVLAVACPAYALLDAAAYAPQTAQASPAPDIPLSVQVEVAEAPAVEAAAQAALPVPRVLIYHTHATEAYLPTADEPYVESGAWRTHDTKNSVVAVGSLLAAMLTEQYGLGVVHDTADYEPPKLSSAYGRSLAAMEAWQKQYPSITLFIDVHRDAYGRNAGGESKDYIELDGKQTARLMFVVGTGAGATGSGFGEPPDFAANYALAERITGTLRETDAQLARDIRVKTGRYNQHVSDACLLVEVGHTANTLSQAKNAVPYLARAVFEAYRETRLPDASAALAAWAPQNG